MNERLTMRERGIQFAVVFLTMTSGKRVFRLHKDAVVEKVVGPNGQWCYGFNVEDVSEISFPRAFWETLLGYSL